MASRLEAMVSVTLIDPFKPGGIEDPGFHDPANAVIIFDWDDTLLPTTCAAPGHAVSLSQWFPNALDHVFPSCWNSCTGLDCAWRCFFVCSASTYQVHFGNHHTKLG